MGLGSKMFGTYSERQIKKIDKVVDYIESLAPKYREMSNEELAGTTQLLKDRLANGETLEDILADAFAAIREADDRILGKRYSAQLYGADRVIFNIVLVFVICGNFNILFATDKISRKIFNRVKRS